MAKAKTVKTAPKKKLSVKAQKNTYGRVSTTLITPKKIRVNVDDAEQLMHYCKSTVWAATDKIASTIASTNFRLYAIVDTDAQGNPISNYTDENGMSVKGITGEKLYIPHSVVAKSVAKKVLKDTNRKMYSKQTMIEIYRHPLLNLLRNPSQGITGHDMWYIIASYLPLIGNAHFALTVENGLPVELRPLYSEYMAHKLDGIGRITSYDYNPYPIQGLTGAKLTPDNCVHFKRLSSGSLSVGRGCLEACIDSFGVSVGAFDYLRDMLNNSGMASMLLSIDGVKNKDEFDAQAENLTNQLTRDNRSGVVISGGGAKVDVKNLSQNLADSRTPEMVELAKKDILNCFGVNLALMDQESANRSSASAAMKQFKTNTIFPLMSRILDQFNSQVTNRFWGEDLMLWYSETECLDPDPGEQAAVLKTLGDGGFISINEGRQELGKPSLPGDLYEKPMRPNATSEIQNQNQATSNNQGE